MQSIEPNEGNQQQNQQGNQQQNTQTAEPERQRDRVFIDTSQYEKKSDSNDRAEKR